MRRTGAEPEVRRVADAEALARAAAEEIARAAARAVAERGRFTLALSGGDTPRLLYELLADDREPFRTRVPWERTHVFFTDERHVPPDHPDSNARLAKETLLDHVPVASVHRFRGESADAAAAADEYERDLRSFFGTAPRDPPPRLDLLLLGLGPDGHTASLFPGSDALGERRRLAAAPWVERLRTYRLTLTLPVLDRGREDLFIVSGAEKADALARTLAPEDAAAEPTPAARVRPRDGELVWIVDAAAARQLRG